MSPSKSVTLAIYISFCLVPIETRLSVDSEDILNDVQDTHEWEREKRASIVSGYRAWKAILRSSHKIAIKGTDETYYQSIYVRSGGFLRALEDFYSLKPSHVQYFQRNNMVFGYMGTIGERTVILQSRVKYGLASKPSMRVFKTDKDGSDNTEQLITYIE